MALLENFLQLFLESAPWLMWGFLLAGIMKSLIPEALLARHLGAGEQGAAYWPGPVKAALLGAPLPLCSCGVIPAALGLRRAGASRGSTMSFLISTPETGVDSISISYALLGPVMAIARPLAAIASAITAGLLVGRDPAQEQAVAVAEKSCCSKQQAVTSDSTGQRITEGVRFVFINLVRDIAPWLLVGLLFAALVKTLVPESLLVEWGQGVWAYAIMAVIGVPMYICATASTPIAAGFLFAGVSPGAVLVFMLAGPATNIATMGLVRTELGGRALVIYLASVISIACLAGYIVDLFFGQSVLASAAVHQHHGNTLIDWLTAGVLALLLLRGLYSRFIAGAAPAASAT